MRRRRTVARAVSASGIGLHSGKPARLTLRPAAPGCGVVFDVGGRGRSVQIPARAEYVVSTRSATVLGRAGARVATVEHLLAALAGLGVDDVRVELQGDELPALDGSSAGFVALLREAGLDERGPDVVPLRVKVPFEVAEGRARARVLPSQQLCLAYAIDFPHPAVGRQARALAGLSAERFERELAPARTFGFARDAEVLRAAGLAGGASLDNTLVFGEEGPLNPEGARWPDEPLRHKLLDLLGDLALLGRPLLARVQVERGGHALHLAVVRRLEAS